MKRKFIASVILILSILFFLTTEAKALEIDEPHELVVQALISFGEEGAAWLDYFGQETLVSCGYMLSRDLRVVAIRHDSVVLYSSEIKRYYAVIPHTSVAKKSLEPVIWTTYPVHVPKLTRMIALAYRLDYISHYTVTAEHTARGCYRNVESMMRAVTDPYHRFDIYNNVIFVAPAHLHGIGWTHLMRRLNRYRSHVLSEWFPVLNDRKSIVYDGRPLDEILDRISSETGVNIDWQKPIDIPIHCSIRNRPVHEILKLLVIYNGLDINPTHNGLEIR